MPYVDAEGQPLHFISLRQVPADGHYFQLVSSIGFRERAEPADDATNPTYWAPAHIPSDNPTRTNRTDLASVPWPFWSFIASYGRQSAPAILHDHQSNALLSLPGSVALPQRREADRLLRVGLRQQKVPLLRAWLMWTFVRYGGYWLHARARFVVLLLQSLLGIAVLYFAAIAAFHTPLALLLLLVPALAAYPWRAAAPVVVWGTYASALLAPLVVLQFLALLPFWLAEILVRELVDRPFVDPHPSTQLGPFFRRPRPPAE